MATANHDPITHLVHVIGELVDARVALATATHRTPISLGMLHDKIDRCERDLVYALRNVIPRRMQS